MSTKNSSKINQLLQTQPHGTIMLSSWLNELGYSSNLQKRYKESNWLESIGPGAMKRTGDEVRIEGAIFALQMQLNLTVHIGAKSALALHGKTQYLEFDRKKMVLFGKSNEKLPNWFSSYQWGQEFEYHQSNFLPGELGLIKFDFGNFSIKISTPTRALLECLYLAPKEINLVECYELMESLNNLSPVTVQSILEQCKSIKVNRLFLYMAEKAGHSWFKYLKYDMINMGKGKRSIVSNGIYIPKYGITVPKELLSHESGI